MDDFEKELKLDFLEEATSLLENAEQAFLKLETDWKNTSLLDEIFRLAHNLKGTSRAVGFGDVAEFTHEMENLILKIKEGHIPVTDRVISVLLDCNDHINMMITGLKENLDTKFDSQRIILNVQALLQNGETIGEIINEEAFVEDLSNEMICEKVDDEIDRDEEILEQVFESNDISSSRSEDALLLDIDDVRALIAAEEKEALKQSHETLFSREKDPHLNFSQILTNDQQQENNKNHEQVVASTQDENLRVASSSGKQEVEESIRVSLSKVEKLNNFVGELVILQTVLGQMSMSFEDNLVQKSIAHLGKLSKEIQEISMGLRMVPVKSTFQKMNRIVRDTSKTLDKKVKLTLIGEETEIDKTVLEHLSDPLVHIVRNAVDHGLEGTDERIACGKESVGNVSIRARHEGNSLVIEIRDDGKGIDVAIIKKKAIAAGIISGKESMSDDDIVQLIFHPGFSTKEQVTEVSGRGVGMDVVKTNISRLSGEIKVQTELGVGSCFKIVLPLTLAIIDGIVVLVGEEKFIIPLTQMHEALRPTKNMVHSIAGIGNYLSLRGEVLPIFNLATTLKRSVSGKMIEEYTMIIVDTGELKFVVTVDDIVNQQQVVIKQLGAEIKDQRGFMGSSILGDGRPSFIIDLNELYQANAKKFNHKNMKNVQRIAS